MPNVTDAANGTRPLVLSPFRGLRYAPDRVSDLAAVTAPPYDILDRESIAGLEAAEPHNIVRIILPRSGKSADRGGARPRGRNPGYDRAGQLFEHWREEGVLVTDSDPALYVYERIAPEPGHGAGPARLADGAQLARPEAAARPGAVLRGILGAVALRAADEHVILPHEDVLPGPVADRLALMRACAANLEPILLAYDGGGPASDLVEAATAAAPLIETRTSDGAYHRVWRLSDPSQLAAIAQDLAPRQALIADGHHRYATYLRLQAELRAAGAGPGAWDSGLALLVDQRSHPLELSAIHRTLAGIGLEDAVDRLSGHVQIDAFGPDSAAARGALASCRGVSHGFLLTDGQNWTLLRISLGSPATAGCGGATTGAGGEVLDTEVLHGLVLGRLLGISDDRINYVHDEAAAVRSAGVGGPLAVMLNPVDLSTVRAIAGAGGRMPRKSTSFGPKPRTGFVMRAFDDDRRDA